MSRPARSHDIDFASAPRCPGGLFSRREFFGGLGGIAGSIGGLAFVRDAPGDVTPASRAPTTVGLCKRYQYGDVRTTLGRMLDEIGGVRPLVKGKHVLAKVNLVNSSNEDLSGVPLCLTVTTHPVVAMALGSLLVEYGARRVTFCDQLPFRALDEAAFEGYGFVLKDFNEVTGGRTLFVNTRNRGHYRDYAWVKVPGGGDLASAWEVNRTYVDTDVLVSLGKLKSHVSGGITASMKNLFGVPPSSLYGEDLKGEPDEDAIGYRSTTMHSCEKLPLTSASSFTGRSIKSDHGHNVPRFIVDLNAAFPIHLSVIDGISTIQSAEGWWLGSMVSVTRPGVLIAGRNPVCTDAVAAAVMGFDPAAPDRTHPFVNGLNYLTLARQRGLGENRIENIEIGGVGLDAARFEFQPTYQRSAH